MDKQGSLSQALHEIASRSKKPLPQWCFCPKCGYLRMATDGVRELCIDQVGEGRIGEVPYCRCADIEQNATRLRFLHAGIPQGHPKVFQNFLLRPGTEDASAAAWAFIEAPKPPPVLTLSGPVGSGKSHLAEAIARETLAVGKTVRYEFTPDLLNKLRPPDDGAPDVRDGTMHACNNAYLLWLDDAFSEKPSVWTAETLFTLIDERVRNERRLIITTNRTTLAAEYARIADRLKDTQTGVALWVQVKVKSFRTEVE